MPVKEIIVDLSPEEQTPEIKAKKSVLSKVLQGNWNTILKGQGIEFAGFRTYTFEDDASQIDWKATLRTDQTLVREYEEYKTLNVYVMLDVSDTMLFSSGSKLKAEHGAELAFTLCDAIQQTGDAVGMAMFTDHLVANFPPQIGTGLTPRLKKTLKDPQNYGGPSGLKNILKYVSANATEPALIILITDFIDAEEGWEKYLDIISQRMDIIGIMLRDPRDDDFSSLGGQFVLQHPSTGKSMLVDTKDMRQAYKEYSDAQKARVKAVFDKTNSGFVSTLTNQDMYEPILAYFHKRKNLPGA